MQIETCNHCGKCRTCKAVVNGENIRSEILDHLDDVEAKMRQLRASETTSGKQKLQLVALEEVIIRVDIAINKLVLRS